LHSLAGRYRGVNFEDEMVEMYPLCAFGNNSVAASIDTPLHVFLPFEHIDHLHPDWGIALAAAANGARNSPQAVLDFLLTQLTPMLDGRLYADLSSYAAAGGAWTGSAAQLQAKTSGLAHLIVGSPAYQVT